MSVLLGGLILPSDLLLEDEFSFSGVEARVERTLGGAPLVWEQPVSGRPIDLVGGDDFAWISRANLQSLAALASAPGAKHAFDYHGRIYRVRFRHEDYPALAARPVLPEPNVLSPDWCMDLRIKLMEV